MNVPLRELHLFAGAGGGILGGLLLGHVPVCAVELEEYPRAVLLQRQRDGILPWFPVWDDVCTFDGHPWRERVDLVAGGFPCQDISSAGKGAGIDGARSGLWREFARIVREVRPRYVFVENSPLLTSRGLGTVLGNLAALGFDAEWGVLGADDAGAPHRRKRIWILAHTQGHGGDQRGLPVRPWGPLEAAAHPQGGGEGVPHATDAGSGWWDVEPRLGRVAHGVADRVDRLRAIGNGQVPAVAALAWHVLSERCH